MGPRHRGRRESKPAADRSLTSVIRRSVELAGRGEPHAASRRHSDLACHPGQPRPSPRQPDYALPGIIPIDSYAGNQRRSRAPGQPVDRNALRLMTVRRLYARARVMSRVLRW